MYVDRYGAASSAHKLISAQAVASIGDYRSQSWTSWEARELDLSKVLTNMDLFGSLRQGQDLCFCRQGYHVVLLGCFPRHGPTGQLFL